MCCSAIIAFRRQSITVPIKIICQGIQLVLKSQDDLQSAAFVDADLLHQLRQHGTGQLVEAPVFAEMAEKGVILIRANGILPDSVPELLDGAVQSLELTVQVGFQCQVLLLRQDAAFPIRVQLQQHPVVFLALGELLFQRSGQWGGSCPALAVGADLLQKIFIGHGCVHHGLQKYQHRLFQPVDTDGLSGAAAGVHPVVGGAAVIVVGAVRMAVGLFGHDPSAVAAADQTGEEQDLVGFGRFADMAVEKTLGFLKDDRVDDGFVGALHPDPIRLRNGPALLDLVADGGILALNHVADVHLIPQDSPDGAVRPQTVVLHTCRMMILQTLTPLVGGGIGDAHGVQLLGDAQDAAPGEEAVEDHPYDGSRLLVNDQLVVIVRILEIAVGGEGADEFALLPVDVQGTTDIDRGGGGHGFVDDVGHAHGNELGSGVHVARGGVDAIVDGDEANPVADKNIVQILAALAGVSAKAAQVLDHHAVDLSGVDILHHPPEAGTVKIGAGPAVVDVGVVDGDIRVKLQMLPENFPLIGDGVGFRLVPIVPGQPDVDCRPPGTQGTGRG